MYQLVYALKIMESISHDFWCYCSYTSRCSQPFVSWSSNKAIVVTLAIGYVAGSENLHTVAQPQYSPQVTTVIFSATVPQKSALPQHVTPSPQGEGETQMSMCDCDLVVCSTEPHNHLFSSRFTLSLHSSSTLCFRWEFLLPLLSALYAIVNEKKKWNEGSYSNTCS